MEKLHFQTWAELRGYLDDYAVAKRERRNRWWFRGHARHAFSLEPTVDRGRKFASNEERETYVQDLLSEFERELAVVRQTPAIAGSRLELLARHHGLPSPFLDWSRSPFVAAYFAFAGVPEQPDDDDAVAIFMLNLTRLDASLLAPDDEKVELLKDVAFIPDNRRALQQRGVFMRRNDITSPLEDQLGSALRKIRVPAREASIALRSLDQMLLNATSMFYDADGAAKTAAWRCNLP